MTPKEKAEQLFNKYATYVVMWAGDINTTHQNCKQCALIAVDEILKANPIIPLQFMLESESLDAANEYWQEVKQEIIKL
jgi:hypothetical protein